MADSPSPAASSDSAPIAPTRTFWQRRVRDPIVIQLTQGMTPEKLSLTIAAGSACALFPVFGVTSLLCFVVALVLRLTQPIMQILNQLLLPVHVATIMLCLRLGETLFRVPAAERLMLSPRQIHLRYFTHFWSHPIHDITFYVTDNADSVIYSIVAWALVTPIYVAAVYYFTLPILREIQRIKIEAAAKAAIAAVAPQVVDPTDHPVP